MKKYTILLSLLVLFSITSAFSSNSPESTCRIDSNSVRFKTLNLSERISDDLVKGSWSVEMSDDNSNLLNRYFDFSEIGMVKVTSVYKDKAPEISHMIWRLSKTEGNTILEITNIQTDDITSYQVSETCKGLVLSDPLLQKDVHLLIK